MKGTNEKWTKSQKINFREKVAQNVDLVHFSIGAFICDIRKTYGCTDILVILIGLHYVIPHSFLPYVLITGRWDMRVGTDAVTTRPMSWISKLSQDFD